MLRPALASLAALTLLACSPDDDTSDSPGMVSAIIETRAGDITLALDAAAAPVTVANFVALAEAGAFDGTSFYRTVRADNDRPEARIDVIQGGAGFDGLPGAVPIAHERTDATGLTHTRGAISMARNEPGSASSEFFIVITDSLILDAGPDGRHPDGEGFAVFGYVTGGMEVAEAIWQAPTGNDSAPDGYSAQWLTEPVRIERIRIAE
ncbi:peptidylprolyl isomerase [Hyphobacterium marinum]|uniref:peptidylprolyl isomerase n=1 Tax=Hyphobacterium marinum TaxID=3116574 RepID=A0ABU7M173_9PROT|nr:peptidylprolyl isomerase [Hyphobacterium sp. Y6023]MEE2567567.1 peptidylprolyl isomerase [Hyphobacterium sp. Y6023]